MTAEIIAVGTELLLGDIVNTNAQWLAARLAGYGVGVYRQTVVGDNRARIVAAMNAAYKKADLVIMTGGLGPTKDDVTREAVSQCFGIQLKRHEPSYEVMKAMFEKWGRVMPRSNKKQANIPVGAAVFDNPLGTAPGFLTEKNGKVCIVLPGPPREMEGMFERHVAGWLAERQNAVFVSLELRMAGIGESAAEERVRDLIEQQGNPTIGTYAGNSELRFRITASGETEEAANALIAPVADQMRVRLAPYIYGEGEQTLEGAVVDLLKARGLTIATAESCTGGLLAARIVNVAGASDVFSEGMVTYGNAAKQARLGVSAETLEARGAVSAQCAEEMARGVANAAGANVGVSTTGIAGPGGGTEEKPVGLVYIAVSVNGETTCARHIFGGERQVVRARAAAAALNLVRKALQGSQGEEGQ